MNFLGHVIGPEARNATISSYPAPINQKSCNNY